MIILHNFSKLYSIIHLKICSEQLPRINEQMLNNLIHLKAYLTENKINYGICASSSLRCRETR